MFDAEKLGWMNGVYMRAMDSAAFSELAVRAVENDLGRELDAGERERLGIVGPLVQERTKLATEIGPAARFLFTDISYDEKAWRKVMKGDAGRALAAAQAALEGVEYWTTAGIEQALRAMLSTESLSARKGFQPIRVAITGSNISPPCSRAWPPFPGRRHQQDRRSLGAPWRDRRLIRPERSRSEAFEGIDGLNVPRYLSLGSSPR